MGFFKRLFINALALWLTILLGQKIGLHMGITGDAGRAAAAVVVMVVVLSVVNATVGLLIHLLTAPFNCLTLGLLTFVINAAMFLLAASLTHQMGFGISVGGFWGGLFGSVCMGIISSITTRMFEDDRKTRG